MIRTRQADALCISEVADFRVHHEGAELSRSCSPRLSLIHHQEFNHMSLIQYGYEEMHILASGVALNIDKHLICPRESSCRRHNFSTVFNSQPPAGRCAH